MRSGPALLAQKHGKPPPPAEKPSETTCVFPRRPMQLPPGDAAANLKEDLRPSEAGRCDLRARG